MDLEGPRGPDLVPTAADWSAWLGIIVPHTLWPGIKPLLAPRSPKRACFGPKCPFWGSWKDSEGPREPDSVPTATGCSAYVGLMVGGLFLAARGPKSPRFSSECPFFWTMWAQYGAKNQNCCQEEARYQAKVCGNHESSPGTAARGSRDPPRTSRTPKRGILGQNGHIGPKRALLGPLGDKKRPITRPKCVITMTPTQSDQSVAIGTKSGPKSGPQSFSSS